MRFEQIIAAVTRGLNLKGIRAVTVVDGLIRATDLRLCMACVSAGIQVCPLPAQALASPHAAAGDAGPPSPIRWQPSPTALPVSRRRCWLTAGWIAGLAGAFPACSPGSGH